MLNKIVTIILKPYSRNLPLGKDLCNCGKIRTSKPKSDEGKYYND